MIVKVYIMIGEEFKEIYTTNERIIIAKLHNRTDLIFLFCVKNHQELCHTGHEPGGIACEEKIIGIQSRAFALW